MTRKNAQRAASVRHATRLRLLKKAMKMLMKYANAGSVFRIVLKDYLQREPTGVEPGIPCENCGAVEARPTHILGGIKIRKCSSGFYVCTVASPKRIFSKLAPEFRSLRKEVRDREKNGTWYKSLYQSNYMNMKTGNAFFDVDELHDWLESIENRFKVLQIGDSEPLGPCAVVRPGACRRADSIWCCGIMRMILSSRNGS